MTGSVTSYNKDESKGAQRKAGFILLEVVGKGSHRRPWTGLAGRLREPCGSHVTVTGRRSREE